MNAMPMMYARELRALGYAVIYVVDAPRSVTLCRPECHYPDISYPYPPWIVEVVFRSQIFLGLFPRFFAWWLRHKLERAGGRPLGMVVLNGFFIALAPYFWGVRILTLSHGSDLDVWADVEQADSMSRSFYRRSLFRYLPGFLARLLIRLIVRRQRRGFECAETVMYFAKGFHRRGDLVVAQLEAKGVRYVPRYDMSFDPVRHCSRQLKPAGPITEILSAVRFRYKTFPDGGTEENKGNDIIIRGLALYYKKNPHLRIHFVEKGEDVADAKRLCAELGLSGVVWHQEMPFHALVKLYETADICFDQLGSHWIGAIGGYALFLGRPLIANVERAVNAGIWPPDNPVCSARTAEEVYLRLCELEDPAWRREVSRRSREFSDEKMGPRPVLRDAFGVDAERPAPKTDLP